MKGRMISQHCVRHALIDRHASWWAEQLPLVCRSPAACDISSTLHHNHKGNAPLSSTRTAKGAWPPFLEGSVQPCCWACRQVPCSLRCFQHFAQSRGHGPVSSSRPQRGLPPFLEGPVQAWCWAYRQRCRARGGAVRRARCSFCPQSASTMASTGASWRTQRSSRPSVQASPRTMSLMCV